MSAVAASPSLIDQPGTVAFLVVFGMGVILFFLFRSMAKHLRKVSMAARAEAEAAARAQAGEDGGGDGEPGAAAGETEAGETEAGQADQAPTSRPRP